jgi:Uma2 family endonuclease
MDVNPAEALATRHAAKRGQILIGTGAQGPLPPELWPNVDHLITEDETPVDNIYSEKQQRLLTESLYASWQGGSAHHPFVAFANVGLYSYIKQEPMAPDVMVSLDVELPEDIWEKRHRSYMIWEYGKPPEVVIEIVSNTLGGEDQEKPLKYARMGVAYYVIYDPYQNLSDRVLRCYALSQTAYAEMGDAWLPAVELGLSLWEGEFEKWEDQWLRWCDRDGKILQTGQERAAHERQRADQAEARADQAEVRADQAEARADQAEARADQERQRAKQSEERLARLLAQLQALGVEPK